MKETLSQFSLDSIEIHASTFDNDIDSGSDNFILAYQDLSSGPDKASS